MCAPFSDANASHRLLDQFRDAKIYGSIIKVKGYDFEALREYLLATKIDFQISLETLGLSDTLQKVLDIISIAKILQTKFLGSVTNPPYMGGSNMGLKLSEYIKKNIHEC